MAKIRVDKVDAARRQIDTAISLLFDGGDPVSIHTLTAAGSRILRDLCLKKGTLGFQSIRDFILPGMERKFWKLMNRGADFFKHADRDPDEILDDVDEEANDALLFLATGHYADLGYTPTLEMCMLQVCVIIRHPNFLKDTPETRALHEAFRAVNLDRENRHELFKLAKQALVQARRQGMK
jgi:hypothetical protein